MTDAGKGRPAVGTAIGEFTAFENASVAKDVLAVKSPDFLLVELFQITQADRTFLRILVPPFQLDLVGDRSKSSQLLSEAVRRCFFLNKNKTFAF
jgi:hypothetical protein